jgi:hypothetical protein
MFKILNLSSALLLSIITYNIAAYIIFRTIIYLSSKLKLGSNGTGIVYIGGTFLALIIGVLYLVSAHIAKYSATTSTFYDNTAYIYSIKKALGMALVVSAMIFCFIANTYISEKKVSNTFIELLTFVLTMSSIIYTIIIYERI